MQAVQAPLEAKGLGNRPAIFEKLKTAFFAQAKKVPPNGAVLDFGSAPRGYILQWSTLFGSAWATDLRDFSKDYIGTRVRFVKSDGIRMPIPDASIDVVVSHSVIEHVLDIPGTLADINRVLKVGGKVFITVAPLYYSATGLHNKQNITNWEHLDPRHQAYLSPTPFYTTRTPGQVAGIEPDLTGSLLNKMTVSQFLAAVGEVPWQIDFFGRNIMKTSIPAHVDLQKFSKIDVLTKGMTFLGTKLV